MLRKLLLLLSGVALAPWSIASEPYASTYVPKSSPPTLIRNATVLTGTGTRIDGGDVLIVNGRIEAVGAGLKAPANAVVIEANGRWVTPGIIDVHSHLGVYASPSVSAHSDGNEMTDPVTANVWAEHSVWPQDPGFATALAGGITTLQILPGSGNLIGGRSVVMKNVQSSSYQGMKFPGAQFGLKMACGENPKRTYGEKGRLPSTRMGNVAGYRQAFSDAQEYERSLEKYQRDLAEYEKKSAEKNQDSDRDRKSRDKDGKKDEKSLEPPRPPRRDLKMETLAAVLRGEIRVHIHCYRADEMETMLDLADEFGFKIAAFHHGVEAYKISNLLAERGVCGALWADWWGFKMEAFDGIQENIAMVDYPEKSCAIVHSDSEEGIQRLNQEAAKAMANGIRAGFNITPERAIRWLTSNPARALGIFDKTGSLEPGKMGDVVIWNRDPFSVYALADQVYIDGVLQFDRAHAPAHPRSDFLLGQPGQEAAR